MINYALLAYLMIKRRKRDDMEKSTHPSNAPGSSQMGQPLPPDLIYHCFSLMQAVDQLVCLQR